MRERAALLLPLAPLVLLIVLLMTGPSARAELPLAERRSGYDDMRRETRAMQDDDATNPGMLWVLDGEAAWTARAGAAGKSCADCHGAASAMKGVAARYPAHDARAGRVLDLEQRINQCRVERQAAPALAWESRELLALSAYVGLQSRGLPIAPPAGAPMDAARERGRALYERRMGQLNLACAQCHDQRAGGRLGGATIPQGQATGYPIYRLEWQSVGSLQRRLRNCMAGVRAEPYGFGAAELIDLEAYLLWRARGMKLETPAVRP